MSRTREWAINLKTYTNYTWSAIVDTTLFPRGFWHRSVLSGYRVTPAQPGALSLFQLCEFSPAGSQPDQNVCSHSPSTTSTYFQEVQKKIISRPYEDALGGSAFHFKDVFCPEQSFESPHKRQCAKIPWHTVFWFPRVKTYLPCHLDVMVMDIVWTCHASIKLMRSLWLTYLRGEIQEFIWWMQLCLTVLTFPHTCYEAEVSPCGMIDHLKCRLFSQHCNALIESGSYFCSVYSSLRHPPTSPQGCLEPESSETLLIRHR